MSLTVRDDSDSASPDVGPSRVHAGVQNRLQVQDGVGVVERDDVVGLDLVEGNALPRDPDRALGVAGADVAEGQIGVPLGGDDAAGPCDLLAQALGDGDHQRRSVGG